MLDVEPLAVELVLLVLGLVLLPVAVLGVSLRTCFVALSQHFTLLDVALEEGDVVVEVCATASPKLPVSIAAAINPIPAIRMRHPPWLDWSGECSHIPKEKRHPAAAVPRPLRDQKEPRSRYRGLSSAAMEQGPRCVNRASVASHGQDCRRDRLVAPSVKPTGSECRPIAICLAV